MLASNSAVPIGSSISTGFRLNLGHALRKLRGAGERKGWFQEEMAFRCGVHRTYVGGVERREYNATVLTLMQFTRALGMRLSDAIRGIG